VYFCAIGHSSGPYIF
nr:immunoglobulin light chain junction region [Macaca mulatta]